MPCRVIAEAGVNWESFSDAVHMIIEAKCAGADYVKFQLFNEETIADSLFRERLKPLILGETEVRTLKMSADTEKIGLVLTPMYFEAVDIAAKYADMIKIRFKDHENDMLIDKAVDTGKPILISVPGPTMGHSGRTWPFLLRVYPLYNIPKYPPEPEDFNLDQACACKGMSSHFPHTLFDLAFAINRIYDDVFIEKHVMINPLHQPGPRLINELEHTIEAVYKPIDYDVSITFEMLKNFISQLQLIERIQRTRI